MTLEESNLSKGNLANDIQFGYFGPRVFLDENDVELVLGLKESVDDKGVFANIL